MLNINTDSLTEYQLATLRAIDIESLDILATELLKKRLERYINDDLDDKVEMVAYRNAMRDIIWFFKSINLKTEIPKEPTYKTTNIKV